MALDHYISQVHLKKFYSPDLDSQMYGIKKKDQKLFMPRAKDVCRIEKGNTNPYLKEKRIIEEFLKDVEPKYDKSISKLRSDKIDAECIYVIAGFVSYILRCSPAAMRMHAATMHESIADLGRRLDKAGEMPMPPSILAPSFTELLKKGSIQINVDEKYPQAVGISNILSGVSVFGNSEWEVLINPFRESPLFSSDFPVIFEKSPIHGIGKWIVPLAPNLAIRIFPNIRQEMAQMDFARFKSTHKILSHSEVKHINTLLVRSAESMVFLVNYMIGCQDLLKKIHLLKLIS